MKLLTSAITIVALLISLSTTSSVNAGRRRKRFNYESQSDLLKSFSPYHHVHSSDDTLLGAKAPHVDFKVRPSAQWFRDENDRVVMLRGVNLGGNTKLPVKPYMPSHKNVNFFEHRDVSFVDHPFPLAEADEHFSRLHYWGHNTLRLLVPWEAIEHKGPGVYDDEYVQYVISLLKVARNYGFKVFLDPHQGIFHSTIHFFFIRNINRCLESFHRWQWGSWLDFGSS
jgi:hypothetical protein